jgi:hypothetical protein
MAKNRKHPTNGGKSNNGTSQKNGKPQNKRPTPKWSPWSTVLEPTPENARKLLKHPDPNVRKAAQRYLDALKALKGS